MADGIRPLRRIRSGVWRSHDERWSFLRHQSDPHPQRWYLFDNSESQGEDWPINEGGAQITLREVVALAHDIVRDEAQG